MRFDLVLVGFGNVGRRFARLVNELGPVLAREHDVESRIVGIATRTHGHAFRARGLDAVSFAEAVEAGQAIGNDGPTPDFLRRVLAAEAATARDRRLVVVETTTLDVESGE